MGEAGGQEAACKTITQHQGTWKVSTTYSQLSADSRHLQR